VLSTEGIIGKKRGDLRRGPLVVGPGQRERPRSRRTPAGVVGLACEQAGAHVFTRKVMPSSEIQS
jgi:hypothetical protein